MKADWIRRHVPLVFALLWVLLSALFALVYPTTSSDTLSRYAPMAEAFARGEWVQAYHPRFGVLFPTLSGVFAWLLPIDGVQATQIAGTLFWVAAAYLAWLLAKHLFDEKTGLFAAILVFISPELSNYAMDGLREGGKAFALLACATVFADVRGAAWWGALGTFVLVTLRVDSIVLGALMPFAFLVWALARRQPLQAYALGFCARALGLVLMCWMTHAYEGVWAPCVQMAKMLRW